MAARSRSAFWRLIPGLLGHPLVLTLLRACLVAAAAGLIGLAVDVLHRWIDLSLALTLYLPLVLLAAMWWDLAEVLLVVVCAVGLADYRYNTPAGRFWPIARPQDGLAYVVFGAVGLVTALVALRSRRQHQRDALADAQIEANRLRIELISTLAQEIAAPLRALDEHTQDLLQEGLEVPPYRRDASLQMIAAQMHRLRAIMANLVQTARMGDGPLRLERSRVGLTALVHEVAQDFRNFVPDHPCRVLGDAGELPVYGDPARLRQMLGNLLDNAARYSLGGAPVTITLTQQHGEAVLGVMDQGIGVMKVDRERIFSRYNGTVLTRVVGGGGPGLGLALCRGIAEAHGGRIWLAPSPGGGSIFRVALPIYGGEDSLAPVRG